MKTGGNIYKNTNSNNNIRDTFIFSNKNFNRKLDKKWRPKVDINHTTCELLTTTETQLTSSASNLKRRKLNCMLEVRE